MMDKKTMMTQISEKKGFIAALDQSGGSTPGALRHYGIPDSAYKGDAEMFRRAVANGKKGVMTAPSFSGDKIIAAILFEGTMDGQAKGKPVPTYLWEDRGVVPFLKVDKGMEAEKDGVQLKEANPALDTLWQEPLPAWESSVLKMRSVINLPVKDRNCRDRRATVFHRPTNLQTRSRPQSSSPKS